MSTKKAFERNDVNYASSAGASVVNRHVWDIEAVASNDLVLIGYLPAFHQLEASRCALVAKAVGGALAAGTWSVFIPDEEGGAAVTANTIFSAVAVTEDTASYTANSLPLICEGLGVRQVNRPIYLKAGAAVTAGDAVGQIVLQLGAFVTDQP